MSMFWLKKKQQKTTLSGAMIMYMYCFACHISLISLIDKILFLIKDQGVSVY